MRRRYWVGWCVLLLFLFGGPLVATAQQQADTDEQEVTSEEEISEETTAEDEAAEGGEADDASGESQGAEPAESEASPEGSQAQPDADATEEQQAEATPPEGDEAEAAQPEADPDAEVVEGPGGAPLQTDYPGTDESLQARMDTGRIEGEELPEAEEAEEIYDLRVRELETQIDDLKERVFRSKSRIALLRESVLSENLAGSRAIVTFVNDLGSRYKIQRAIFSVDGSQVFSQLGANGEFDQELEIFTGPMTPGTHTVSVTLGLQGSGYGIFSYAEGYEFDLRFSCQFTAEEGRTTLVTVRSYKSGNAFTAHEERPDGICKVSMVELDIEDFEDEVEDLDTPDEMQ